MAKRTKIKKVANAEIRAAKKFLESKGLESDEVSPKKFATAAKIVEVGYLEQKNIDIYVLEEDCDQIEYICTVSKLLADDDGNGVNSRICSKV